MNRVTARTLTAALPAAGVMLVPGSASAHPLGGGGDFLAGLVHPFLGPDHVLAIVAVALLATRYVGAPRWQLPALFLGALAAGWLLSTGAVVPALNTLLVMSVVVFLVLAGLGGQGSRVLPISMAGLFGALHGYAHGSEIGASSPAILGGMLTTSILMLAAGSAAGFAFSRLTATRAG